MKKLLLLCLVLTTASWSLGQTVLTYATHALTPGTENRMVICPYVDPRNPGRNAVWNFTGLERTSDFMGTSGTLQGNDGFETTFIGANVCIEEFGNKSYFDVSEAGMQQLGFYGENGSMLIIYDEPFVKMKFPFAYGDEYSGNYHGSVSAGCSNGTISGTYHISADGGGTLLLPDDVTYDNVLREKEVKILDQTVNDSVTHVEIVTYRWYIAENTYPVLSMIRKEYRYANGQTAVSTLAAYNAELIFQPGSPFAINSKALKLKFNAYPNPSNNNFTVEFTLAETSACSLALYDLNGKKIRQLVDLGMLTGTQTIRFSAVEAGLARGTYLLKLVVNDTEASLKIVRQ